MKFKKLVAHRGLHSKELSIPENSIAAFKNAVNEKFDIELDVQLSKDKHVVVFHDENLKRMTGVDKKLSELTLSELKKLRLSNTNECIPTLAEALKAVKGRVGIMIELKNYDPLIGVLEKAVYCTIKNYQGYIAVISFNPLRLRWFLKNAPTIDRGQLVKHFKSDKLLNTDIIRNTSMKPQVYNLICKPDFVSIDLRCVSLDKIMTAYDFDNEIVTWTARSTDTLEEATKFSKSVVFENFIPSK